MKLLKSTFERRFVEHTMMIALPIMLQNGITNFVNMLDNIMVGRIGTDPMTGVSIVNSLLFVWNLCLFGGLSGIGTLRPSIAARRMMREFAGPSACRSFWRFCSWQQE